MSDTSTARKSVRVTGKERAGLAKQLRTGYEKGASIRALAATSGKSYGFVHRLLTEAGVTLRARGGPTRGVRKNTAPAARKSA